MLETIGNLSALACGTAVVLSLIYVGFQLNETRKQMKASALQQRANMRIEMWRNQIEWDAYQSALDKFFEHELYRLDLNYTEIDEITLRERRALSLFLGMELFYFQNLFYLLQNNIVDEDQCGPLFYMRCFNNAPARRHWKDFLRLGNHFPYGFVEHVDGVVKKYDSIEEQMSRDQNADFEALVLEYFDVPAPPPWAPKLKQPVGLE